MTKTVPYRYIASAENDEAQLVIAQHKRQSILTASHDSPTAGHTENVECIIEFQKKIYWNGMRSDIDKYIENCTNCKRYKNSNLKPAGLLQTTPSNHQDLKHSPLI